MAAEQIDGPWSGAAFEEIHLDRAPLIRVLCQVRFPRLARLAADPEAKAVNAIALDLDTQFPQFEVGREIAFQITQEGVTQTEGPNSLWRFVSADGAWQASLAAEFVSLETSNYTDRGDFIARLLRVVDVLSRHVPVPRCARIGFRYTNRVTNDVVPLEDLRTLLLPQMLGGMGVPLTGQQVLLGMNEAIFDMAPDPAAPAARPMELPDGVQARWGLLPAGGQLDVTLPPYPQATWMLDIDSFRMYRPVGTAAPLTPEFVGGQLEELSLRAYQFFRWAVTGKFLTQFGAQQ